MSWPRSSMRLMRATARAAEGRRPKRLDKVVYVAVQQPGDPGTRHTTTRPPTGEEVECTHSDRSVGSIPRTPFARPTIGSTNRQFGWSRRGEFQQVTVSGTYPEQILSLADRGLEPHGVPPFKTLEAFRPVSLQCRGGNIAQCLALNLQSSNVEASQRRRAIGCDRLSPSSYH